jgi:hypothetical protein
MRMDWTVGLTLQCLVEFKRTWYIIMVDLEHLVAITERLEAKVEGTKQGLLRKDGNQN